MFSSSSTLQNFSLLLFISILCFSSSLLQYLPLILFTSLFLFVMFLASFSKYLCYLPCFQSSVPFHDETSPDRLSLLGNGLSRMIYCPACLLYVLIYPHQRSFHFFVSASLLQSHAWLLSACD